MAGKIRSAFRSKEELVCTKTSLIFPTILVDLTENTNSTYKSCLAYVLRPPSQQEQANKKPFPPLFTWSGTLFQRILSPQNYFHLFRR